MISLQQEYHRDSRTDALAEKLGVPRYAALGLRVELGLFAARYVPDGAFAGVPPWLIARASTWEGNAEVFVVALCDCGIMDDALQLIESIPTVCFAAPSLYEPGTPVEGGKLDSSPITKVVKSLTPHSSPLPPDLLPVRPSSEEIAIRLQNEPEMSAFFAEAQSVIGTFGHPQTASLVMAHDYYGLSWEVLLVLLHSVRSMDEELGVRSAAKTYEDYAKKLYAAGVNTAEDAERFFAFFCDIPKLFRSFSVKWSLTNSKPTTAQREKFERWTSWGFSEEMIDIAYQTALDKPAKQPFSFADKVLTDWHANKIFTPDDVAKSREAWAQRLKYKPSITPAGNGRRPNQAVAYSDAPPPSHSLEKAEALSRRGRRTLPQKNIKKG